MQQKISFSSGCYITSHLQVKIMLFCSFFFHLFSCLNREIHKTTKEHSLGPQVFHICTVIDFMILILEEICVNWSKHLVKKHQGTLVTSEEKTTRKPNCDGVTRNKQGNTMLNALHHLLFFKLRNISNWDKSTACYQFPSHPKSFCHKIRIS